MSKGEKAASDSKRMWLAQLREERKEAEQLARVERLESEVASMRDLLSSAYGGTGDQVEPPKLAAVPEAE